MLQVKLPKAVTRSAAQLGLLVIGGYSTGYAVGCNGHPVQFAITGSLAVASFVGAGAIEFVSSKAPSDLTNTAEEIRSVIPQPYPGAISICESGAPTLAPYPGANSLSATASQSRLSPEQLAEWVASVPVAQSGASDAQGSLMSMTIDEMDSLTHPIR